MADLSVLEWDMTDMQRWHQLAQAWTAFENGLTAGTPEGGQPDLPGE